MYNRADIWTELNAIAPGIATIGNQDVYQVPDGYFENFAQSLMLHIQNVAADIPVVSLPNQPEKQAFNVPEGYFDGFAANLLARIKAEKQENAVQETESISPLLNRIDRRMPFDVPAGYFNDFSAVMSSVINSNGYTSVMLEEVNRTEVYSTPAGYFEDFSGGVLALVSPKAEAKVVSFKKRTNWIRYAAAAVVVGVIATSSILFFRTSSGTTGDAVPNISRVADDEIISYLDNLSSPPVSADESNNSIASADILNEGDAKDLFSDVSDDELQQYVEQHENSKNLITN